LVFDLIYAFKTTRLEGCFLEKKVTESQVWRIWMLERIFDQLLMGFQRILVQNITIEK
jgi:hypothetical protein